MIRLKSQFGSAGVNPGMFCSDAVPVGEREELWTSTAVQAVQ